MPARSPFVTLLVVVLSLGQVIGVGQPALAAGGDLDPSFGNGGKVLIKAAAAGSQAYALVIQADGKIVAAGEALTGSSQEFGLLRLNPDGTLDPSFSGNGKLRTAFPGGYALVYALLRQAGGFLMAAGTASYPVGEDILGDFALARYNHNGIPDSSFGVGGTVTTDFTPGSDDQLRAAAIQSDGKILAAGRSNADFALARYMTDGSLDPDFGNGGLVTTDFNGNFDRAAAVMEQADGSILAVGNSNSIEGTYVAIAKYTPDGSLDRSFGGDGRRRVMLRGGTVNINAAALDPNGKVVMIGQAPLGFAIARFDPDGFLDQTFGHGGTRVTSFGAGYAVAFDLALQADGKIVAAGYEEEQADITRFALVRYKPGGRLDLSFGDNGKIVTPFGSSEAEGASAVAVQADGAIVVAGWSALRDAFARYLPN